MRWTRRRIHQSMEDNVIKRVAEKAWAMGGQMYTWRTMNEQLK